ncbi:MAG TPA: hypothetical protein VGD56_12940 [Gemmatirosa sp.]
MANPDPHWPDVAADFAPDGSLRDIYVAGAGEAGWEAALALVRRRYGPAAFSVDGRPAALPARAAECSALREAAAPVLAFDVGGVRLGAHFFVPDEVEFDLRPEEVGGPAEFAALVTFLRDLAVAVGRPAVLTAENLPAAVMLRADPATGAVTRPPDAGAPAG